MNYLVKKTKGKKTKAKIMSQKDMIKEAKKVLKKGGSMEASKI